VNAFEKDDAIIIDLVAYKDADIVTKTFNYKYMSNPHSKFPQSHLKRYTINLEDKSVISTSLGSHVLELPQINPTKLMHEYRYLYAASGPEGMAHELIKVDLQGHCHHSWHSKACYVTEPIFVAKPNAKDEDDGIILSLILDVLGKKSSLLILDAKCMKELARISVPHHIPFTVHSKFFAHEKDKKEKK